MEAMEHKELTPHQLAAKRIKERDPDFYKKIGRKGGKKSTGSRFKKDPEFARKVSLKYWDNVRNK